MFWVDGRDRCIVGDSWYRVKCFCNELHENRIQPALEGRDIGKVNRQIVFKKIQQTS